MIRKESGKRRREIKMNIYTGEHISIPIKIVSSGYAVNLGAQSFTAEISPYPIVVSSEETELRQAYNNLKRKIRDKRFSYHESPFWSKEPID
jgi:hypothetical protein